MTDHRIEKGVWAGSAQKEKLRYWTKTMSGEVVTVPGVSRWGEIDGLREEWEDIPEGLTLAGILLPPQMGLNGQTYRLLKIMTAPATGKQLGRFEKDRAVEYVEDLPGIALFPREPRPPKPPPKATRPLADPTKPAPVQGELF